MRLKFTILKEYYEIVNEARILSGFSPQMLICLQKCISNHETKQSSKFQSDTSSNCFTIDVLSFETSKFEIDCSSVLS